MAVGNSIQGALRGSQRAALVLGLLAGLVPSLLAPAAAAEGRGKDAPLPDAAAPQHEVMAQVNGEVITHDMLAEECLRHYGKDVRESMFNRLLIEAECRRQNVSVGKVEVDKEVERLAARFNLPVDQWLKMLKQERGIKPAQYASDIIWPTLALRKLAGERLQIGDDELRREFESLYGPSVRARLIITAKAAKAQEALVEAKKHPDDFGNVAKRFSEDPSAAAKGLIQPIRKHLGYKEIEQAAFQMQDGQISDVIRIGEQEQYAIVKREQLLPAYDVKLETVKPRLEEVIRDRKLRSVAQDVFKRLQESAQVQIVMDKPELRQQMPGVAAVINGRQITIAELAAACIDRHGEEVLEGTINRKLIEQAIKRAKLTITDKEIDDEVVRVAGQMVPARADGSPDVDAWIKLVMREQRVTPEIYRRDIVWPSVALRKLVGDKVRVTEEDLHKGFEANYGPKMKCRAIVLENPRVAQRVWELAKKRPDMESFGELAERYSCDPSGAQLQGEMPPIRRNGGEPLLEAEAFALQPGEISSVIQVGPRYVILLCEGRTKPIDVEFAAVRQLIYDDIFDKKMQLAMSQLFDELQNKATVDNFLAGKSQSPRKASFGPRTPPGMPIRAVEPRS